MAVGESASRGAWRDRWLPSFDFEAGGRLWGWVFFSSLLHLALIYSLFVMPRLPPRRASLYPVYTVDLVGGERIGSEALGSVVAPVPSTRKEKEQQKAEPSRPQAVKREKRKAVESPPQMRGNVALKETKRESQKEPQPAEGVSGEVRDKLIQAALERVRARAETEDKKRKEGINLGSSEGQGAAALGSGGSGGGIVKGIEFVRYYSAMLQKIRDSWTWVGKRSDLEVTVRFGIQENGEVVALRIVRNSGDASYDDSVFRAVRKVSPLPSPPESYRKDFMDVELTFRPKDLGG